jgi:dihydroxycyclohexadiene carboxylate dehydrogenase
MQRFKDQVVVITGAAQGIGRGVALQIAQEAGQVVLLDRSPLVAEVLEQIQREQGQAIAIHADLEDYAQVTAAMAQVVAQFSRIDVLINNVGGAIWMKPYSEFSESEIRQEIQRSLFPTLWGCHAVLPQMLQQQQGVIVNVSSVATRGIYRIPYSAAKGGVNALTASLAMEYAEQGIRINAVATGGTDAPARKIPRNQQPLTQQEQHWMQAVVAQTTASSLLKRYGSIAEQVNAICFLASAQSSYMTGSVIAVGGGDQG